MTQSMEAVQTSAGFSTVKDYENVIFEMNSDGVAKLTLNRPDSLNALTAAMGAEIRDALKLFEADSSMRVMVLTGAGRGFCAGADLKGRASGPVTDSGQFLRENYNPMVLHMTSIEKPIIAAVNGVAAGAGFSLALACDMRVASEKAKFVAAFARIGLVPDCGLSYFLPRLIGVGRAMEITTMGGEISATEAKEWGMVNKLASAEDFETIAMELATRLAKGPTTAIGKTKKLIQSSLESELADLLEGEASNQTIASSTSDFREGVMAFIEKRPARFTGK